MGVVALEGTCTTGGVFPPNGSIELRSVVLMRWVAKQFKNACGTEGGATLQDAPILAPFMGCNGNDADDSMTLGSPFTCASATLLLLTVVVDEKIPSSPSRSLIEGGAKI